MFSGVANEGSSAIASKKTGMSKSAVYYGLAQAKLLAQVLTRRQLPGLNSIDQLYLLALSDTVASTNLDLESDDVQERGLSFARKETHTGMVKKSASLEPICLNIIHGFLARDFFNFYMGYFCCSLLYRAF